jgi:hypothetical protein
MKNWRGRIPLTPMLLHAAHLMNQALEEYRRRMFRMNQDTKTHRTLTAIVRTLTTKKNESRCSEQGRRKTQPDIGRRIGRRILRSLRRSRESICEDIGGRRSYKRLLK